MDDQRRSSLALLFVRLPVGDQDYLLLMRHQKWGDWGPVGGHVEAGEDWKNAADREADEELTPLRLGRDSEIVGLDMPLLNWGPVQSRSAGGQPTTYQAAVFGLRFLGDPVALLNRLPASSFLLVSVDRLTGSAWDPDIADSVAQVASGAHCGLSRVARAWPIALAPERMRIEVRPAVGRVRSSSCVA